MTEAKHDRRCERQRERRVRRQADCVLRAAVRAMGGDPDDFMDVDGYGDEKKYGECRGVDE